MTKRDRKKRMETGPDSAGQGGATQQISENPIADFESVEELHEIPEDDVPGEYLDNDDHLA